MAENKTELPVELPLQETTLSAEEYAELKERLWKDFKYVTSSSYDAMRSRMLAATAIIEFSKLKPPEA